jgi:hypothetical protein
MKRLSFPRGCTSSRFAAVRLVDDFFALDLLVDFFELDFFVDDFLALDFFALDFLAGDFFVLDFFDADFFAGITPPRTRMQCKSWRWSLEEGRNSLLVARVISTSSFIARRDPVLHATGSAPTRRFLLATLVRNDIDFSFAFRVPRSAFHEGIPPRYARSE